MYRSFIAVLVTVLALSAGCAKPPASTTDAVNRVALPAFIQLYFDEFGGPGGYIRPYGSGAIVLAAPDEAQGKKLGLLSRVIRISRESKMNGQAIDHSAAQDMVAGFSNNRAIRIRPDFAPNALFPHKIGVYRYDFIFDVGEEQWVSPPCFLKVQANAREQREIAAFEQSGANAFLLHPRGIREVAETEVQPLDYGAVARFVRQFPDSYLTQMVKLRIERIWLRDLNTRGLFMDADRQALAPLLARLAPRTMAEMKSIRADSASIPNPNQHARDRIEVLDSWIRYATQAPE